MVVVGIDTSIANLGFAEFVGAELRSANLIKTSAKWRLEDRIAAIVASLPVRRFVQPPDLVLIEYPRTYGGRASDESDANDLITETLVSGALFAMFHDQGFDARLILPQAWKGSTPKPQQNTRDFEKLSAVERSRIEPRPRAGKLPNNNVLDAIGICLAAVGRSGHRIKL